MVNGALSILERHAHVLKLRSHLKKGVYIDMIKLSNSVNSHSGLSVCLLIKGIFIKAMKERAVCIERWNGGDATIPRVIRHWKRRGREALTPGLGTSSL